MNERIRAARINAGLSQKEVSITLHVSAPTVSEWESGRKTPSTAKLIGMADLFNTSTDYLLGRTIDTEPLPSTSSDTNSYPLFVWLSASKKQAIYDCLSTAISGQSLTEQEVISFAGAIINFFPRLHTKTADATVQPGPCPLIDIFKVAEHLSVQDKIIAILREPDNDFYPPEKKRTAVDLSTYLYTHRRAYENAPPLIQDAVRAALDALLEPYEYGPTVIAARVKEGTTLNTSGVDLSAAPNIEFNSGDDVPR